MTKPYPRISFDVDGILADFYKSACAKYDKPYEITDTFYVPWINEFHDVLMDDDEFWLNLPTMILPNEIQCYIHCYITSIDAKQRANRETWLTRNGYQNRPVIISHAKEEICNQELIDIHIDDKLSTCIDILEKANATIPILHLPWYLKYPEEQIPSELIVTRSTEELMEAISNNLNSLQDTSRKIK